MTFAKDKRASAIYWTPEHRKARKDLLAAYQPGDPCCLCGHAMWPPTRNLHADHDPLTGGYRGLAHGSQCETCGKRCNQVDGARRGRARQGTKSTPLRW